MKTRLVNPNYQSNYIENLLTFRGVNDYREYLMPTEKCLQEPEELDNVQEAYEILMSTLSSDKTIALIVDCDVDGFTSSAVIYQYLKDIKPDVDIKFFLHEHKEHGL